MLIAIFFYLKCFLIESQKTLTDLIFCSVGKMTGEMDHTGEMDQILLLILHRNYPKVIPNSSKGKMSLKKTRPCANRQWWLSPSCGWHLIVPGWKGWAGVQGIC